ncbi:MAG: hypothetical protein ACRD6X_03635 [Pyrinomonadaceae bacterium]
MIDLDMIEAIVAQYSKHSWDLRRILLGAESFSALSELLASKYSKVEIRNAVINAIWFSRPNGDAESWELRRIDGLPYALVRVIPNSAERDEREGILNAAEIEIDAKQSTVRGH